MADGGTASPVATGKASVFWAPTAPGRIVKRIAAARPVLWRMPRRPTERKLRMARSFAAPDRETLATDWIDCLRELGGVPHGWLCCHSDDYTTEPVRQGICLFGFAGVEQTDGAAIFRSLKAPNDGACFVGAGCTAAPLSFRPPSSSGLGFRVLSAATGVRSPVGVFFEGEVA